MQIEDQIEEHSSQVYTYLYTMFSKISVVIKEDKNELSNVSDCNLLSNCLIS